MKDYIVYLSSTDYDLLDIRRELIRFLRDDLRYKVLNFEDPEFPGTEESNRHDKCVANVDKCDYFVVLVDKKAGGKYHGKHFYASENGAISITWAEAKRAFDRRKEIIMCVRSKTWNERSIYNRSEAENRTRLRFTWISTDPPDNVERVVKFLNYLQCHDSLRPWLIEFDNIIDLKEKLAKKLDAETGGCRYWIRSRYRTAVIRAGEVRELLDSLYKDHKGEIWLLNNDLELIKSSLFHDVYLSSFKGNKHITAIRLLLHEDKYKEFTDPANSGHAKLVSNLRQLGRRLSDISVGRLKDFPSVKKALAPALNIVVYTSANNPDDPDSIALLRPHMPPFSATIGQHLSSEDLLLICRQPDCQEIFSRMKTLLKIAEVFANHERFTPLRLKKHGHGFDLPV